MSSSASKSCSVVYSLLLECTHAFFFRYVFCFLDCLSETETPTFLFLCCLCVQPVSLVVALDAPRLWAIIKKVGALLPLPLLSSDIDRITHSFSFVGTLPQKPPLLFRSCVRGELFIMYVCPPPPFHPLYCYVPLFVEGPLLLVFFTYLWNRAFRSEHGTYFARCLFLELEVFS